MRNYLEREKVLIDYYIKSINDINEELDELIKNENVRKYIELERCSEVKKYIQLKEEKEFFRASLKGHRNSLSMIEDFNKSRSI